MTSRGLVAEAAKVRDILKFHNIYERTVESSNFEGDILAYVTPVSFAFSELQ